MPVGRPPRAGTSARSAQRLDWRGLFYVHRLKDYAKNANGFSVKRTCGTRPEASAPVQCGTGNPVRQIHQMSEQSVLAGSFGPRVLELADHLAQWSETRDSLTCTYLTPAHRRVADELIGLMAAAGMAIEIDAVSNVIARLPSTNPAAKTVIVGSHYDTVINAGKYDGRLGILVAIVVVDYLRQCAALPFHVEIIGFSDEEGVRFPVPYIGSSAVAGRFDQTFLERRDANGLRLGDVIRNAGLDPNAIPTLVRSPKTLRAYLEVHIEQGPVLLQHDLPVGVVTAIAGNVRYLVTITGVAGHAGAVPMTMRRDAAAAAAEIVLFVERRCSADPTLRGTVGRLIVPDGATNVIAGLCKLSIDIRSADDQGRDSAAADILTEIDKIAARRGVTVKIAEAMRTPAVPCSQQMVDRLADAIERMGLDVLRLPSGPGHDAVMFDGLTDIGMLFVRCGNGGISHSPLETVTAEDVDIAARVLLDALLHLEDDAE
jgi:beta-ureidopropionase / N-carbamoyl-L-amino-acid hydrolase